MITQSIVFNVVPNAIRYEVEIEQLSGGEFVRHSLIETINTRVNLSLRVGFYRYKVTAYNIMEVMESLSDWQEFRVYPAVEPTIDSYQPFYGLFYEMAAPTGSITIRGKDFYDDSTFALVKDPGNYDWTRINLRTMSGVLLPNSTKGTEGEITLSFNRKNLQPGEYDIFIRNPGGKWSLAGKVHVGYKNPVSMYVDFGYAPMAVAMDTGKQDTKIAGWYEGDPEPVWKPYMDNFNSHGYYFRLGLFVKRMATGNFALELQNNFILDNYFRKEWAETTDVERYPWTVFSSINSVSLNVLYQWVVTERWMNNFRLGIGLGTLSHDFNYKFEPDLGIPLMINFGITAQYFLWKNLSISAGADFKYIFEPWKNIHRNQIYPVLGLAWQLGRWAEHAEIAEAGKWGEDPSYPVISVPKREHLLSLGWAPMIPLNMDHYARQEGEGGTAGNQHLTGFNALGLSLRYGYLPIVWGKNKFGFDMEFTMLGTRNWKKLDNSEAPAFIDNLSELALGARYQRVLLDQLQLNGRLLFGAGNAYIYTSHDGYDKNRLFSYIFKAGLSAQYFFWQTCYAEAGLDFTYLETANRCYLKPHIGIGFQFNLHTPPGMNINRSGFPRFR